MNDLNSLENNNLKLLNTLHELVTELSQLVDRMAAEQKKKKKIAPLEIHPIITTTESPSSVHVDSVEQNDKSIPYVSNTKLSSIVPLSASTTHLVVPHIAATDNEHEISINKQNSVINVASSSHQI